MAELQERLRKRVIYVRDDDIAMWADAVAASRDLGIPLSLMVSHALRDYVPLRRWRSARKPPQAAA